MAGIDYLSPTVTWGSKRNGGGLNSTSSPLNLEDNESSGLQNIDFNKFGSILKRNGYLPLNTTAFNSGATWTSLHWFEKSNGSDFLIGTCGNKLGTASSLSQAATPFTDSTGSVTITAGSNNHWNWATYLDTAMGTNNIDVPIQWTGSGNASAMTVPTGLTKAKFIEVFNGYTFFGYVTVSGALYSCRVYWSGLDSITSWDSADFRDVNKNDGQDITGIKTLGDRLVIFKDRSIWIAQFTGDADFPFTFTETPSNNGCISGGSIQKVDNGLIFLSQDGYYYFDGLNSYKISDRITATFGTFSSSRFQYSRSCYQLSKNRYWGSFTTSGGSSGNRCITWDSYNNAFSIYKGQNPNCFAIVNTGGEERVYFGDYSGYVYRADTGTDDYPANSVTSIDAYYYTKWFNFDDFINKKGIPNIAIFKSP